MSVKIATWFIDVFFDNDGSSFPVKFVFEKEKEQYVSSCGLLLIAGIKPERVAFVWEEIQQLLPDVKEVKCRLIDGNNHEDCLTLNQTAVLLANICLPEEMKVSVMRFVLKSLGYNPQ